MYIYQPRQAAAVSALEPVSTEAAAIAEVSTAQASAVGNVQPSGKKKRKRH
jgi:hypothetical protein